MGVSWLECLPLLSVPLLQTKFIWLQIKKLFAARDKGFNNL